MTSADNQNSELAASGELGTGSSPPFRARLNTPAVPGYEIGAELGRGGMGVVYQARHLSLKRLVALKMILAGVHLDPTARARFRTEAEAVARLQHPNIVQIHEVGEHEGRPFLSLEYIDGGSLQQNVAGMPQPEREAARLMETLARAVHYTHQRGILHRDLKPTNVLLARVQIADCRMINEEQAEIASTPSAICNLQSAIPKITDFGLAKLLDSDGGPTRSESFLGTPGYMAPEQAGGDPNKVGTAADVYSLGVILYELLTGRPPFQGATPLGILEQVRNREPVPPRRLRPSLSIDLETICLKCLEKEPGNRYSSADALADDLRCFLEEYPIKARPVPALQRLWKCAKRRPTLVAWGLAAAALVCLFLTVWAGFLAADQRNRHRAEEKYQRFIQRRNEALVCELLAPEEGSFALGKEAAISLETAESYILEALALAGVDAASETPALAADLPDARKAEVAADCYALLLVLASVRGSAGGKERYQEALRILDHARQLGFQNRSYHMRRANFLDRLGEQQEARKDRDRADALPPEGALDHFLIGEEHYRRGNWKHAVYSFNRALAMQPGHFWAQFLLAVCNLKVQQPEAAKAGLNACLAQQPDFVWVYLFRSVANEMLQARSEAETDFALALQLNLNTDARYFLFLIRGIHHFNQRELERAASDFRSAMSLKPEQYNAYLNLAQVYLARGQLDEAEREFRTAMRFRPPVGVVAGYHRERGRCLLREKRYEEAVRACETALALSTHAPLPHVVRGRALLALGRYQHAERSFDQYLRQGGEVSSDVFTHRGLARMKLGKYPEAVDDFTRALERTADANVYRHRGWAHFFSLADKLALRDFSRAIELDPAARSARIGRELTLFRLGRYREAIKDAGTFAARFLSPAS